MYRLHFLRLTNLLCVQIGGLFFLLVGDNSVSTAQNIDPEMVTSIFYFQCNIFTRAIFHHPTRANVNKLVHSCMSLGLHSIRQVMYCTTHLCMPFTCNGKWGHIRMLHRKGIFTFVANNFVGSMY